MNKNPSISEKAYAYYYSYLHCENNLKDSKLLLIKSRYTWDKIDYKGFRYINTYRLIAQHYLQNDFNIDSVKHYYTKGIELPIDYEEKYLNNYQNLKVYLAMAYRRTGDISRAINLLDKVLKSKVFEGLTNFNKSWFLYNFADLFTDSYQSDNIQLAYNLYAKSNNIISKEFPAQYKFSDIYHNNNFGIARIMDMHFNPDSIDTATKYYEGYISHYKSKETKQEILKYLGNANHALGKLLTKSNPDTAKYFLQEAIINFENYQGDYEYQVSPYIELAKLMSLEESFLESKDVLKKGLDKISGGKLKLDEIRIENISNVSYPIQVINIITAYAKILSIQKSDSSKIEALKKLDLGYTAFHIYFNQLSEKSKIEKKLEFENFFQSILDVCLQLEDNETLFKYVDKIKYSFLLRSIQVEYNFNPDIDADIAHYFVSSDKLHAILKRGETYSLIPIGKYSIIKKDCQNYLDSLYSISNNSGFAGQTKSLFEKLVKPLGLTKNTLIIPTGILNNIPFDALIYRNNKLEKVNYAIDQQLSLAILNEIGQKKNTSKKLYFISPSFASSPDSLYASIRSINGENAPLYHLPYAEQEVNHISDIFSTAITNSNKVDFFKTYLNGKILHFAGHAISSSLDNSFLAIDSNIEDSTNIITQLEILNSTSNNDLVVLSACKTASGEYLPNEGTLSLSRAFFFAGAKSVVSTLWSINDKSTSIIMTEFYKELLKGKRKDEALRQAKLTYLDEADPEYQHPYYWAGFIAMGDMSPLFFPQRKWYYVGLGLLGFLIIGFLVKKKINSSRLAA